MPAPPGQNNSGCKAESSRARVRYLSSLSLQPETFRLLPIFSGQLVLLREQPAGQENHAE